jgi:hypothetical protein
VVLYNVEYITKNHITYNCKVLCESRECLQKEIRDISSSLGEITILGIHQVTEVHRISSNVMMKVLKQSTSGGNSKKKIGRPRKYII